MKGKPLALILALSAAALAQDSSFQILEQGGETFLEFMGKLLRFFVVAAFLGALVLGGVLLLKKVRAAMVYAKQSGDEDPALAGAKAAIPWGIGLFLFIVLVLAVLDFVTGGAFRQVVREVLTGGGR